MSEAWPLVELTHRYFRGVDTMDEAILRACLSPSVEGYHSIVGAISGIDQFIEVIRRLPPEILTLQHYLSNHEVEFSGEGAKVRASLFAQHVVRWQDETLLMPGGGRYQFDCRWSETGWVIQRLRNDVTWGDPRLTAIFSPRT